MGLTTVGGGEALCAQATKEPKTAPPNASAIDHDAPFRPIGCHLFAIVFDASFRRQAHSQIDDRKQRASGGTMFPKNPARRKHFLGL